MHTSALHQVPFYKNSPDSTRCVLACMQMVLKMLEPEREYSFDELDKIVKKKGMMGVWHFAPLIYIAEVAQRVGGRVVVVETFPYHAFRYFPVLTCLYYFGWSAGLWQVMLSALRTEARFIHRFLEKFPIASNASTVSWCDRKSSRENSLVEPELGDPRTFSREAFSGHTCTRLEIVPKCADLLYFLDNDYICLVQLNGYMLDGEKGYGGHMVLVMGYDADSIIIHNPRLPGSAYRHYARDVFEAAWHSPRTGCANFYAVQLRTRSPKAATSIAA